MNVAMFRQKQNKSYKLLYINKQQSLHSFPENTEPLKCLAKLTVTQNTFVTLLFTYYHSIQRFKPLY